MVNQITRAVLAMAVLLTVPSAAMAQRWGRSPFPGSGACFFRATEFRGEYFCMSAGEDIGRIPEEMNDQISSIRLFGRAEVIVFGADRFRGGWARFDRSIRDLRDERWNDRISSLRVGLDWREPEFRERRGRFDDRGRDDRGRDERGRDDRGRDDRDRGREGDRREGRGVDVDQVIKRAYQDVLGRDPDEGGLRQYRSRVIDDHWSEEQIRESLRSSPEYRERVTMTRAKAQEIVRRAYQNVLKREPDAGADGYINRVWRENWSQDQVERELRNSPEFRQRNSR